MNSQQTSPWQHNIRGPDGNMTSTWHAFKLQKEARGSSRAAAVQLLATSRLQEYWRFGAEF